MHRSLTQALFELFPQEDKGDFYHAYLYLKHLEHFMYHALQAQGLPARKPEGAVGEDVGRHNAVDKAIGKLILTGALDDTACLVMSSRISYELVQKVGRARIPIVVAISRPTSLAVDLARKLNITLVCIPDDHTLLVYSAPYRIRPA